MGAMTLKEVAELVKGELRADPKHLIEGVNDLFEANTHEASFVDRPKYAARLSKSEAGVVLISPQLYKEEMRSCILVEEPSLAFQQLIDHFLDSPTSGFEGIHPTAVIHPSAKIHNNVYIGPYCVIAQNVEIQENCHIEAQCYIGANSSIGCNAYFYPQVTLREGSVIGNRVILQPGVVIGSCGYGYHTDGFGTHTKLSQLGNVVIEDDVEIGANTTIDRARFKSTRVKQGTKIDNLVQIAHQVEVGEYNLIVAQAGIAGSTKTGRYVVMGGQSGAIGHAEIGDGVIIAARSSASKSLKEPGAYLGNPCMPAREFREYYMDTKSIKRLKKELKNLKEELCSLKNEFCGNTPHEERT